MIKIKKRKKNSVKAFFYGIISHDTYDDLERNIHTTLHDQEMPYFSSLKFTKRKTDYLTSRYIAKTVIGQYLNESNLAKIQMSSGIFKHPFVRYRGWENPEHLNKQG